MYPFRTLSEKEGKQISYIKAYIWNLENWYRLIYLQVRKRDAEVDVEMTCRHGRGPGRGWVNWEIGIDRYTLLSIKWAVSGNLQN